MWLTAGSRVQVSKLVLMASLLLMRLNQGGLRLHLTRLRRANALSMRLPTFPTAAGVTTALRLSAESEDTLLMDMMEVVGYR